MRIACRSLLPVFLLLAGGCSGTPVGSTGGADSGDSLAGGDGGGNSVGGDTLGDGDGVGDGSGGGNGDEAGSGDSGGLAFDCSSCHGSSDNNAPPIGLGGVTDPNDPGIGAHQAHVAGGAWHRPVVCNECHLVPASYGDPGHVDTRPPAEVTFDSPADANGAAPSYDFDTTSCSDVYCHGVTLKGPVAGGAVARTPDWTVTDGTYSGCGNSCHTNPPAAPHAAANQCEACHGSVIASYDPDNPAASVWKNASLHINGTVEAEGLGCTSCHGSAADGRINPPFGTGGESETTEPAVGAHVEHLTAGSGWHRLVNCTDCHLVPVSTSHANGLIDLQWSGPSAADGANPDYDETSGVCSNVYCHGATLIGPRVGGVVNREPAWTVVNGTYDSCGDTCHTLPPASPHPNATACESCHGATVSAFDATTPSNTVFNDPDLHINGVVDVAGLTCTTCHGDPGAGSINPPVGVAGETGTDTLAVGRHVAHVNAGSSHAAYGCELCHVVPVGNDLGHTLDYVPSADLATAGHHGDVTFSGQAAGTTWNVDQTAGTPIDRRGTCVGGCHSNGRGGAPAVTPWWAGGTWDSTSCANCHGEPPGTGEHRKHVNGEGLACADCHPAANDATHTDGNTDLRTDPGGVLTVTPNACSGGRPSCNGSCHGENHRNACW